jgi:NADH-quinone oxidoreductase subunit M
VVAIIYGGFTALAQTDLKKLVAYSSVAHMGFATLGIFTMNSWGIKGALLVMINHGVTTGALFIIVGIIYERLHTRDLGAAAGLGKVMPMFAMFAGVFALSSLAFPGTNSFIGEFLVMSGGFQVSKLMMVCVVPGVVLAAAYMLRMLQRVAYGGTRNPDHSGLKDLGLREVVTLAPLLLFVFWIGLHPEPFTRVMEASVQHLLEQTQTTATATTHYNHRWTQIDTDGKGTERNLSPAERSSFKAAAQHGLSSPESGSQNLCSSVSICGFPRASAFGFPSGFGLRTSGLVSSTPPNSP